MMSCEIYLLNFRKVLQNFRKPLRADESLRAEASQPMHARDGRADAGAGVRDNEGSERRQGGEGVQNVAWEPKL